VGKTFKRLETKAVHAGVPSPRIGGAVIMPIFQSAMFEYAGEGSYHDLKYIRLNNTPSHTALHAKLAALENGEAAVATSSGMAAVSTTLLTVLAPGDRLLAQDCLYGGTHDFLTTELKQLGIETDFIDADDPASWEAQVRANTRAIYVETISNPLMRLPDLESVVRFARSHGLVSLIDNTFATPVNFRPLEQGFDLILHSCTKYLNGHSDIVAGAAIGSQAWIERITHRLNHLGGSLDPHACFLLDRGLKTLVLRVRHQNESARH
jgi:cystathionine beta-lyase/cystathionine gamma-synthase